MPVTICILHHGQTDRQQMQPDTLAECNGHYIACSWRSNRDRHRQTDRETDRQTDVSVPGSSAGEEDDAFQFAVVEEIVERPDAAFLTVRVRRQVRVVAATSTARRLLLMKLKTEKIMKLKENKKLREESVSSLLSSHHNTTHGSL